MNRSFSSKTILLILLVAISVFLLFSCTTTTDVDQENDISGDVIVESIQVDTSTIPDVIYAGQIPFRDIRLIVNMSDGTQTSVEMAKEFI